MGAKKIIKEKVEEYEFMTIKQFAEKTTYHPKHVEKMIRQGKIESRKLNGGKRVIPLRAYVDFIESEDN